MLIVSILTSCSRSKPVKPNTPANTLLLLSSVISSNNYDSFNALFSDGRKNSVSKEKLAEFNKITTAGSGHSLFGLLTYPNGEMLLVRLVPIKIDGKYKVEDVVKVPEDMKKLFQIE